MSAPLFYDPRLNPYFPTAASLRRQHLEEAILPYVADGFRRYPYFRSAMLCVAQYWNDNADDAVHPRILFSELETPDLEAVFKAEAENQPDRVNWPSQPARKGRPFYLAPSLPDESSSLRAWDHNGLAIPAFAAYCREGATQNDTFRDAYAPYAIIRSGPDSPAVEVVGQPLRPWLEGVQPQYEWEEAEGWLSIDMALEQWQDGAWRFLADGRELCHEALYRPTRAFQALFQGVPYQARESPYWSPPPVYHRPGLPADLTEEARAILYIRSASDLANARGYGWTTLQDFLAYPDWDAEVNWSCRIPGPEFKDGMQTAALTHYPQAFSPELDDGSPWLSAQQLNAPGSGSELEVPWRQLWELVEQNRLRQGIVYRTRLFYTTTVRQLCAPWVEICLPRLQDLVLGGPQNLRLLYRLMD